MAWNQSGGNGNDKDPWGNRGGDQGPPDLDEAFRQMQSKLSNIFGGGGSGGSSGSSGGGKLNSRVIGFGLVALVFLYGAWGVYQIDAQERGVVFRFGSVQSELIQPGLAWNPPIVDVVEKVNVTKLNSHKHQSMMLTEDENIVDVSLEVQYRIDDPIPYLVKIRDPEISLQHATESALRHVVGSSTMDAVITEGRATLGDDVQTRLQSYLDRYETGVRVSTVNIDRVGPPPQVQEAFADVQRAKEDEVRYTNEANAYAEQIIPVARGNAQKAIEGANAYRDQVVARSTGEAQRFSKLEAEYQLAKGVTRDRLYIEAMESVLGNSSKIMVDVAGGNNMLYLPLDQIRRNAIQNEETAFDPEANSSQNMIGDSDRMSPRTRRGNR